MISSIDLLQNKIDISRVPFSDRGSRLLVYKYPDQDCLNIQLAERLTNIFPGLESYTKRAPFIQDLIFIDQNEDSLSFEITTHPHVLKFQTCIGTIRLIFQNDYTLCFNFPSGAQCGLHLRITRGKWEKSKNGGVIFSIRNLLYTTNAKVIENRITAEDNDLILDFLVHAGEDNSLSLSISDKPEITPHIVPFSISFQSAKHRWERWFDQVPAVDTHYQPTYAYAWWVLANNMILPKGNIKYEVAVPSKNKYIGIWLWDNAMHALAFRYIDSELARNQIRAILAHQQPDGMLPDAVFDDGIITEIDHPFHGQVTKPPILTWAVLKIHEIAPDLNFLKEIYEPLKKWNAWWFQNNDDDRDGIVQYNHPYSSGLDDNPTWDFGMPVESPDLNTYLCIQMQSLAVIADLLNNEKDAEDWKKRAKILSNRMIEDMWDFERGIFNSLHKEKPIPVLTPLNLYPLWTGYLPDNICAKLIEHIKNPREFWGDFMLPSVSRNDPKYDPDQMWRGPVWANINYFFIEALKNTRHFDLAKQLRERTLNLIMNNFGIFEYYNADTGKPGTHAAPIFGWTAAVFIDLAIQASKENINY